MFYYSFLVKKAGLVPLSLDKLQREKGKGKKRHRKKKGFYLNGTKYVLFENNNSDLSSFLHKESRY